jgi:diguanylate cyclase (GGDEF)-like protein
MHGGRLTRNDVRAVVVPALVLAMVSTTVAIGALLLAKIGALGIVVMAVLTMVAVALYRGYLVTSRRHQRLELLHDFVSGGVGAESLDEVAQELLVRIRSVLRATNAELTLLPDNDTDAKRNGRRGAQRVSTFTDDDVAGFAADHDRLTTLDWTSVRALDQAEPLLAPRSAKDRAVRGWLQERGYRDAIVVPLPTSSGFVGMLTVTNRLGETATFTQDDLTLLQTLTGHLAVAAGSARLVEQLGYEATHDTLTGLANRAHLSRQIEQHVPGPDTAACVLLLDLDRFKEVNDGLGHAAGDRLLLVVAQRLQAFLPASATVARLGGDEFAILIPNWTGAEAAASELGHQLAAELARPVNFDEALLTPDASIGVALAKPGCPSTDLLRQADTAMYAAKTSDTTVAVYHTDMDSGRVENLALLADLRAALREQPEQIALFYQPKIDLATRRVVSAEALVRWNHPTLGIINPDRFVPLAENTGLIDHFTPLILRGALVECARWREQGTPVTVAVNLSARNVGDSTLPGVVAAALSHAGVPSSSLILEITESSIIADPQQAQQVLAQLAELGVTISLDDFGTGYSSLSYLQRLPVQEVKIDRSFVRGLTSADPHSSRALISSIAGLGANLGLRVVAEGVEADFVLDELQQLGCHVAQGFAIAHPAPAREFRQWLQRRFAGPDAPLRLVSTG